MCCASVAFAGAGKEPGTGTLPATLQRRCVYRCGRAADATAAAVGNSRGLLQFAQIAHGEGLTVDVWSVLR
ncbi:hypothetical protein GCM10009765_79130 [Fodinicola feengrottensis]|uniref:Uncharacterized protein n=1 Tax=Fodinicola feengrottensis TaxID=435914 RepID=A0ABN2J6B3_9ACTN